MNTLLRQELRDLAAAKPSPRVTVVRAGGLGDTVLVLPALQVLRERLPGARLTLVGSHWAEDLRPLVPFPLDVARSDASALTPLFGPAPAADPTGLFAGADAVVLYTDAPHEDLAANAARFCRGPAIVWPVTPVRGLHAAEHFARAVLERGTSGAPAAESRARGALPHGTLCVPEDLRAWARAWIDGRLGAGAAPVAVHPGSGGRSKCWPAERFAGAAAGAGAPVLLVEGPADAEACRQVLACAPASPAVARAAGVSVAQLGALLAACRVFLGNDSGVSHLAAALGVPTVAVFGPTDPAVWAPAGRRVRAVGSGRGRWPDAAEVREAVRSFRENPGS